MVQSLMRFTMSTNQVFDGPVVSLLKMLEAREKRQVVQQQLITKYPNDTLLSITLNIPGEIKNSISLEKFFNLQLSDLQTRYKDVIIEESTFYEHTGNEAFLVLRIDPMRLKRELIEFEESLPARRILDLDVLYLNEQQLTIVSRRDYHLPPRRCLVCERDAKVCGRERKHPVEEIQQKIAALICSST
ncbi:citrate lyase holo-[acyl-carrier protein] synthase [Tuanshanicoccus lijuaniae]|uniref:citrate lyase holo-[acyl-carrier protein] synthase n=2 Tax=Aerococcaceae bacterium zg-1292 TaxID=2774330 RepID=UPI00193617E3|nr:citrate lyase holo-[acyl-carrier protein] synthase [Aerococcaceae bacterium zg-1292]QQA37669.1 citrate lyase holo-[acyl-carrier protein] synthase [Aerococcaceae bacterium zg-1292]